MKLKNHLFVIIVIFLILIFIIYINTKKPPFSVDKHETDYILPYDETYFVIREEDSPLFSHSVKEITLKDQVTEGSQILLENAHKNINDAPFLCITKKGAVYTLNNTASLLNMYSVDELAYKFKRFIDEY